VPLEDPVTTLLDRIQAGHVNDAQVRYFTSRVRAGEQPQRAVDNAIAMVRRSFAAFKAQQANAQAAFEQKIEVLRAALASDNANLDVAAIAASTGLPVAPLIAVQNRFQENPAAIPNTILEWSDWLIEFFHSDIASYKALLAVDAPTVNYVVRGKKKGDPPTAGEFERLKRGFRAWLTGRPLCEIETSLGVAKERIKHCPRARDLVLKLANRSFYLIAASVVEVARNVLAAQGAAAMQPSVLETLAVAIRKGLDTPDKVAFAYRRPTIRSRVLLHASFARVLGESLPLQGQDYATILTQTTTRLGFAANEDV
jgi:ATP-dependent RNA helicase HelY